MIAKYKERVKSFFTKKLDYKEMYYNKEKECDSWEFKYNKLNRQLRAILKEGDA